MATVTWTKNSSNQYEVATVNHLLQLMNQGALYTDAGNAPSDYWNSDYIQTADIDLVNDHASIVPIGNDSTKFTGKYDGGGFEIRNWSYSGTDSKIGLFGYCYGSVVLKHMRLSGVWTLSAHNALATGFLVGQQWMNCVVYDVQGDFDTGTSIGRGSYVGCLIGRVGGGSIYGLTVMGTIDSVIGFTFVGGVVGYTTNFGHLEQCRNLATFPGGISGSAYVGGILGYSRLPDTLSKCLNVMRGNLTGSSVGGICGYITYAQDGDIINSLVNSMVGNISSTGFAGGIFGQIHTLDNYPASVATLLNYMNGDIVGSNGSGGIVGHITRETASENAAIYGDVSITKTVVAMQGTVDQSVRGSEDFTPSIVEVTVDTSFGMTYTGNNDYGLATMVVDDAFVYNPNFTDLPYVVLSGTDPDGTTYNWDFVYGNMGGKISAYTHLSVHTAHVSAPFPTVLSGQDGTTVYLTYANVDENVLYTDASLGVVETTAEIAFNHAKSRVLGGSPNPSETVTWTKNSNGGQYLVQSRQHLLQIMSEGNYFGDAGDAPTDYWGSSYLQTADIDLADDHARIVPIGNDSTRFMGEYDGGLFQIKNWAYAGSGDYAGLFGYCSAATLKQLRLAGVWTILTGKYSGFLGAVFTSSTISDVEGDFSEGTSIGDGSSYTSGTLVGSYISSSLCGLTVRGTVEFGTSLATHVGGVIGYCNSCTLKLCRNLASFPSGISGNRVGGIVGQIVGSLDTSQLLNAMKGDLIGTTSTGGIVGRTLYVTSLNSVVNSMTGNITSGVYTGGIVGEARASLTSSFSASRLLNYMRGDISATTCSGGIIGYLYGISATDAIEASITKSVVAMCGSVGSNGDAVLDRVHQISSLEVEVTVDTSFGMAFDSNTYGSATMVVDSALVYHSLFTDLPYFKLEGTDSDGKVYDDWDFLFANVGGKYSKYTDLSVHTADVSAPIPTVFSGQDGTTVYLTYANTDENVLYTDASLGVVETTAVSAFDHAKSRVLGGSPNPSETVTWTKNSNGGQYLVESRQHLLQIMSEGNYFGDAGDAPTDYWGSSYLQTADIDLVDDHARIVPIGNASTRFMGEYDGGLFQIKNWSCTSSLFGTQYMGLFGYCSGATIKHIRLAGVWTILTATYSGFLVAFLRDSSTLLDVEGDFSEGTSIGDGTSNFCGTLVGYTYLASVYGATVRGTVEFGTSVTSISGGIVGYCGTSTTMKLCRNLATFPNGISGIRSGGIMGANGRADTSQLFNGMKGDIIGRDYAGGIVGRGFRASSLDSAVNSMTGNISGTVNVGGIVGQAYVGATYPFSASRLLNYMRGDISATTYSGGIIGDVLGDSATDAIEASITKSVVAMCGSVGSNGDAVLDRVHQISSLDVEVTVDTSFGMTYDSNTHGSATMVVDSALVYHPLFTDLPYFKLEGTDHDGKVYDDWDFLFANVGGKYSKYTDLSVHTAHVSAPIPTVFSGQDGTTVYLTYANVDENVLYTDASLGVVETTAVSAFDHAKSRFLYGTPDPSETLTWTKDADGRYEVATVNHMLQLMSEGTMFTDLGDHPRDYWSSAYIQTADIDLQDDHASIAPIGNASTQFAGEYDGGLFQISNWSLSGGGSNVGLFGLCNGVTLKRIRLAGVWTIGSGTSGMAALVARALVCSIFDIEADFAEGTTFADGHNCGTLVGYCTQTDVVGATVRGTVDMGSYTTAGGVIAISNYYGHVRLCRNLATFPTGIRGTSYVGGIVGFGREPQITDCVNGMTGDLFCLGGVGGIQGSMHAYSNSTCTSLVNSMHGNITGAQPGGIFSDTFGTSGTCTCERLLNYMQGNIVSTGGTGGGVIGLVDAYATISASVVAMRGSVNQSVVGEDFRDDSTALSTTEVTVDTSFGMTYDSNTHGSATMVVDSALVYHPSFTDLPYIKLEGTDPDGKVYDDWDFVYGNMGGKYDKFTHLSVHTAQVSAPFPTVFSGLDGTTAYLTYANTEENSLYIDSSNLTIGDTTAEIAFDYAKSAIVYGTPYPSETLAWTKNADGKFEVATVNHLLQLMSGGSTYTDLGDHPRDYWGSAYIQTADIDLVNDHASIAPIGNDSTQFTGEYDGGLFQIMNWAYAGDGQKQGLFGYCYNARLTHIRLTGTWILSEAGTYSGFLCAYAEASERDAGRMYDVEGDFSSGTLLAGSGVHSAGSLIGRAQGNVFDGIIMNGLTVGGIVDMDLPDCQYVGGVVGYIGASASLYRCRNIAAFTNGITGISAGGVVGAIEDANIYICCNGMTGNIIGASASGELAGAAVSGGVCGSVFGTCKVEAALNSMSGNISAAAKAGGIVGLWSVRDLTAATGERMLNYMKGDILGPVSGGLVGSFSRENASGDVSISSSIVAMHGNVAQSVRGTEDFTPSMIEVTVDTSFGMFFDTNDYGSSTMVTHMFLYYATAFPDLPYFRTSGNDQGGNLYEWDFLFANIGGKYADYTHLTLHTSSEILVPIPSTLGSMAVDNTVLCLTYANTDEQSLYIHPSLTVIETTADVVFDHAKTVVVYGTPTPSTTVSWTQDADGKFEVATKQHLLQVMNKGSLYTDLGVVRPSSYWTHHYVQTAEIDLQNDEGHFVCIGDEDTSFIGSYEHDGFEVLNWQHDGYTRLFGDRTTLMWTQDAEGRYEVQTVQHLLQLMERGERFVNEGDFPSDHWGASAHYIQTADIDLQDWHAKIHPIGNATNNFYGQYDGGGHAISNWSYTQPENSPTVSATGLFGAVVNAEIKGVRLNGVWTMNGGGHASTYLGDGFLCGSAIASTVYDVESNLEVGTMMAAGSSTTAPITHRVGCLIGLVSDSVVCNVTLSGTVGMKDFGAESNTWVGGVIGYVINAGSSVTLCRNVATFPNGITGQTVGGLVSYFQMGTLSHSLNAMQGDVFGIAHAGGICGVHDAGGLCEVVVNSMTGNIQATENAGGMHGCVNASGTDTVSSSQLLNYMSGSIQASHAGGIAGLMTRLGETGDVQITNSIVAMHGTVEQHVSGSANFVPSAMDVVTNTDFGMVGGNNSATSSVELTGFATNPAFADLPYIPLMATDPDGVIQSFDFVFANLGGKTMYSGLFTHLTLHTSTVSAPYRTDFGIDSSNTEVYLTYANLDAGQIFVDDALSIVVTEALVAFNHAKSVVLLGTASLPLICEPRSLTIKASVDAPGSQFRLTHQETSQGSPEIMGDAFTGAIKIIAGLTPETTYVIRLYADEIPIEHLLVKTGTNSAENYDVADFYVHGEELYDISKIGDQVSSAIVNEIFTTGDVIAVDMKFARKTTMETTFVKKGELVDVDDLDAVLLPFDLSTAETQQSTIKLPDESSVTVSLEQGSGEILVGGVKYPSGKSFVIGGRKCTVFDI